jgi:hypothetical protein
VNESSGVSRIDGAAVKRSKYTTCWDETSRPLLPLLSVLFTCRDERRDSTSPPFTSSSSSRATLRSLANDFGSVRNIDNRPLTNYDIMKSVNMLTKFEVANAVVRKLSFTGSTEVGRILMAQCAPSLKKPSLERCGNGPFIVFDDAAAQLLRNTGILGKRVSAPTVSRSSRDS